MEEAPAGSAAAEPARRLFEEARTAWHWREGDSVEDDTLRALYDLAKLGPTSGNSSPARFVFVRSVGAKLRLRPALSAGNVERAMGAPVIAIVARDPAFHRFLPELGADPAVGAYFAEDPDFAAETARRNATLGGAWLIMAARALGLDCGPMSGFDNAMVDEIFLRPYGWESDFLVCLGHADQAEIPPRAPRLSFADACLLL